MDSENVQRSVKHALAEQVEKLNPFYLKRAMEENMKKIFQLYYKNSR
jgi:hypothetical protein